MKVGFIGAGNMGSAVAKAVVKSGLCDELLMADVSAEKLEETTTMLSALQMSKITKGSNAEVAKEADYLFLAVKPQFMAEMLSGISETLKNKKNRFVIVTMAAGLEMKTILKMVDGEYPIIRMMPNTPVGIGEGVIQYCAYLATEEEQKTYVDFMKYAGLVDPIAENLIDAASAVSGCGPAYMYLFLEALADGGVSCGLPRAKAMAYAAQMMKGSAMLFQSGDAHPGTLKDAVCSPGGSTIQGVRALEENGFRGAVMDAVIAAYEKTLKMK